MVLSGLTTIPWALFMRAMDFKKRALVEVARDSTRFVVTVALVAGGLVLAGAVAAGQRRRIREAVILKVLGARRSDLLRALLLEYGLLGVATALVASLLGSVAAWAVLVYVLKADWTFLPGPVLLTVLAAILVVMAMGLIGTARALNAKAAPFLRND